MVERYTKSEYLKLKKELKRIKESKTILEKRKQELYAIFRDIAAELDKIEKTHNAGLAKVRDDILGIAGNNLYRSLVSDANIQSLVSVKTKQIYYMQKSISVVDNVEFPNFKGENVPIEIKKTIAGNLAELIKTGSQLDENVKKADMLMKEIKQTGRKIGYLEKVAIPKLEESIKIMKARFDEKRREELSKIKKFKSVKE